MPNKIVVLLKIYLCLLLVWLSIFFLVLKTGSFAQEIDSDIKENDGIPASRAGQNESSQEEKNTLLAASPLGMLTPEASEAPESEEVREEPLIINGDIVEYSTEDKQFSASGNVVVVFQGTKLTCDRLSLNSDTKDCEAEGNVRMESKQGIIEGSKIVYNFVNGTGLIIDAKFQAAPFFGKAEKEEKVSDEEFKIHNCYMTTCSLDHPHFRMKTRLVDFFPGDKLLMKDAMFYAGAIPLLYLPEYKRNLKDPMMQVQVMPGTSKDWGPYFLTAWRYSLTEDLKGRIYVDYRSNYGIAEGLGINYDSTEVGKGDFKLYYTQERDKSKDMDKDDVNAPKVFQRYFVRLRHKWDIDEMTNAVVEYYKIVDSKRALYGGDYNILKDYFPREYERDIKPLSYISMHRSFDYSSVDLLIQPRVNRWYGQEEKLPEIKFNMPNIPVFNTSLLFQNDTSYVNYKYKNPVPSPSWDDTTYNQFYFYNKLSIPVKLAFFNLTPALAASQTYNDNKNKAIHRALTVVYSYGSDISTKFYRLFPVKTNLLGLSINNLRHIITPTASYTYSNSSTMPLDKARFGGGSSLGDSTVALSFENKLQTKRGGKSVDLAMLRLETDYLVKPKTGEEAGGSHFTDLIYRLELAPYRWLSIISDGTYKHSGSKDSGSYNRFTDVSYDVGINFDEENSFTLGQRYKRKGGNEIQYTLKKRLTPKWKLSVYHRFVAGSQTASSKGFREQEYAVTRDLHCWEVAMNYNMTRGKGESVWIIFRMKAFPELEFDMNRSYNAPKPGSQGYQE